MKLPVRLFADMLALASSQGADSLNIVCDESGWSIYCLDPSHTSMVAASIGSGAFTDYAVTESFCIDVSKTLNALKNVGDGAEVTVGGGRFILEGNGMKSKLPLLTYTDIPRRIPEFEPEAEAEFSSDEFRRIIKAASDDVSQLCVQVSGGKVILSAEDEQGMGNTLTLEGDGVIAEGEAKSHYAFRLLAKGIGAIPKGTMVNVSFSTNFPMFITLLDEGWEAKYLVAPQINEEE